MTNNIKLKVYNKDNKIKVLVQEPYAFKIITIYEYEGDIKYTYSFTSVDVDKTYRGDIVTYYDYTKTDAGIVKENLRIANNMQEHEEKIGDGETIKTTTSFISGNVYENRRKENGNEYCETQFTNGELSNFRFPISENKINEYLKTLHNGKEKN